MCVWDGRGPHHLTQTSQQHALEWTGWCWKPLKFRIAKTKNQTNIDKINTMLPWAELELHAGKKNWLETASLHKASCAPIYIYINKIQMKHCLITAIIIMNTQTHELTKSHLRTDAQSTVIGRIWWVGSPHWANAFDLHHKIENSHAPIQLQYH